MPPRIRVTQAPDPLADLRADVRADVPASAPTAPVSLLKAEPRRAPAPEDEHTGEAALARIVGSWHANVTTASFAHGGGTCGCRYLAQTALAALRVRPSSG